MPYPLITLNNLQIGLVVTVDGKQYKVSDYYNYFTKKYFLERRRRTFAMIKPDGYRYLGQIIDRILSSGFYIKRFKTFKWTLEQAQDFYMRHMGRSYFQNLTKYASSDICAGLELVADNAAMKWCKLMGPQNVATAKSTAPHSIRALYGTDSLKNAVHGSDSPADATNEIESVFGYDKTTETTAVLKNCSCLFVKPHAIETGNLGLIIGEVMGRGFKITAIEQMQITRENAEDFYRSYRDKSSSEYNQMIEHVISGPIVGMIIK